MARQQISLKQLAIDKDNAQIVIAVGVAVFVVIFSLIASNALLKQRSYQARVIDKKKTALNQLKKNATEVGKLQGAYQAFAGEQVNVLGGNPQGGGDKDGENPRLVLDALPSKYDFPALTTSLEKVFKPYSLESIGGTDDELAQAEQQQSSASPTPAEIPFTVGLRGTPQSSKSILELFERSIRPMQISRLDLTGGTGELSISVTGKTYYQPQKKFDVRTEEVQ